MEANTDVNLLGWLFLSIIGTELSLHLLRTQHGVYHGGEIDQKSIANGFDNHAVMFVHCLLDELIMDVQQAQRVGFVGPHLAAKAHDVRKHDRGQPARLRMLHLPGGVLSGEEYTVTGLAVYRASQWVRASTASHTSEKGRIPRAQKIKRYCWPTRFLTVLSPLTRSKDSIE
jgi:hypothetical protein